MMIILKLLIIILLFNKCSLFVVLANALNKEDQRALEVYQNLQNLQNFVNFGENYNQNRRRNRRESINNLNSSNSSSSTFANSTESNQESGNSNFAGLSGSWQRCEHEGEFVPLPVWSGPSAGGAGGEVLNEKLQKNSHNCFTCICRSGRVECERQSCPSLKGCFLIVPGVRDGCCELCKGCEYGNTTIRSGSEVTELDPSGNCLILRCLAGVLTKTTPQCYSYEGLEKNSTNLSTTTKTTTTTTSKVDETDCKSGINHENVGLNTCTPCAKKKESESEKCLKSSGSLSLEKPNFYCRVNGEVYRPGQVIENTPGRISILGTDEPCVTCKCSGSGQIVCMKLSCPVLACPPSNTYLERGECCPKCQGSRTRYLPRNVCVLGLKVYPLSKFRLDTCTMCECIGGNTAVCTRLTCPFVPFANNGELSKFCDTFKNLDDLDFTQREFDLGANIFNNNKKNTNSSSGSSSSSSFSDGGLSACCPTNLLENLKTLCANYSKNDAIETFVPDSNFPATTTTTTLVQKTNYNFNRLFADDRETSTGTSTSSVKSSSSSTTTTEKPSIVFNTNSNSRENSYSNKRNNNNRRNNQNNRNNVQGICSVHGNGHYKTYDGRLYTFRDEDPISTTSLNNSLNSNSNGTIFAPLDACSSISHKYLFTGDCSKAKLFTVRIRNNPFGPKWSKTVTLMVKGLGHITLSGTKPHRRVKLNGQVIESLPFTNSSINLKISALSGLDQSSIPSPVNISQVISIETGLGVKLFWDERQHRIDLIVPPNFKLNKNRSRNKAENDKPHPKLCGLCSDFNGDRSNDLNLGGPSHFNYNYYMKYRRKLLRWAKGSRRKRLREEIQKEQLNDSAIRRNLKPADFGKIWRVGGFIKHNWRKWGRFSCPPNQRQLEILSRRKNREINLNETLGYFGRHSRGKRRKRRQKRTN